MSHHSLGSAAIYAAAVLVWSVSGYGTNPAGPEEFAGTPCQSVAAANPWISLSMNAGTVADTAAMATPPSGYSPP